MIYQQQFFVMYEHALGMWPYLRSEKDLSNDDKWCELTPCRYCNRNNRVCMCVLSVLEGE